MGRWVPSEVQRARDISRIRRERGGITEPRRDHLRIFCMREVLLMAIIIELHNMPKGNLTRNPSSPLCSS